MLSLLESIAQRWKALQIVVVGKPCTNVGKKHWICCWKVHGLNREGLSFQALRGNSNFLIHDIMDEVNMNRGSWMSHTEREVMVQIMNVHLFSKYLLYHKDEKNKFQIENRNNIKDKWRRNFAHLFSPHDNNSAIDCNDNLNHVDMTIQLN